MLDPGPGTTSEALNLEPRITLTTQDSNPGLECLLYGEPSIGGTGCANVRTSGSVGAPGGNTRGHPARLRQPTRSL